MKTPVNKQVEASYVKQLLELDSMIVDSTKAFNAQINDYLKTRIFIVKQIARQRKEQLELLVLEKFKVTLKCDSCGKEFQGEYGDEEDISDAACDASCSRCGSVLCPQCSKIHDCQCEEDELPL
jgi:hypothetical protein